MGRGASLTYHIIYLTVGFLYPAYASLHAIETPTKKDDTIWLAYWIVFSLFSILEFATDFLLGWFPLYTSLKISFLLWCVAPVPYNGAFYWYKVFIAPFYSYYGHHIDHIISNAVSSAAGVFPPYPETDVFQPYVKTGNDEL